MSNQQASQKPFLYRYRRYLGYIILTLVLTLLPFIKINGNQFFLLSFNRQELHLLGIVFHSQELYLMPFLLILLFVGIFFITTLGGRLWCGWGCPQTIFRVIYRDLIETKILGLHKKISNKQIKTDFKNNINLFKKIIGIAIFFIIALFASATFLFYFVPPADFIQSILTPFDHKILISFWLCIAIFMTFDITFMAENFCVYVCPYARVQSVLFDNDTLMAIYDPHRGGNVYDSSGSLLLPPKKQDPKNECINCQHCVQVCPTHIDIRKGMQLECINCLECVDACTLVMQKFNQPSLIQWSSQNATNTNAKVKYLRGKTIGYLAVLAIVLILMIIMGSKKEPFLVSIDRNTQLYEIRKNGAIDNFYVFLFENTDKQVHHYSFKILNQNHIEIFRPTAPISVQPNQKIKEVVILRAFSQKKLNLKNKVDETIPIQIEIFAQDQPEMKITRESIFVMPK